MACFTYIERDLDASTHGPVLEGTKRAVVEGRKWPLWGAELSSISCVVGFRSRLLGPEVRWVRLEALDPRPHLDLP
jgi:hypothetical protein